MALHGPDVLRKPPRDQQSPQDQFAVIQDPVAFKRDLRRRRGGATSSRKQDRKLIDKTVEMIMNRSLSLEQSNALVIRNPNALEYKAALQVRQRQTGILQQASPVTQPALTTENASTGIAQELGHNLPLGQEELVPEQRGDVNLDQAIQGALNKGDIKFAERLQKLKTSGRASGKGSGKPIKVKVFNRKTGRNETRFITPDQARDLAQSRQTLPGPVKDFAQKDIKLMADIARKADSSFRLSNTFKDGFGGAKFKTVALAIEEGQKRFGDSKKSVAYVSWWRNFRIEESLIRKALFGSQIPEGEMRQWEKLTITPNMTDVQIRAALKQRAAIEKRSAARTARTHLSSASGNRRQVIQAFGGKKNLDRILREDKKLTTRAAPQKTNIPQEAIGILRSDPSPQSMRDFDAVFGKGAARRVLGSK
jgi:hypothetical protein